MVKNGWHLGLLFNNIHPQGGGISAIPQKKSNLILLHAFYDSKWPHMGGCIGQILLPYIFILWGILLHWRYTFKYTSTV